MPIPQLAATFLTVSLLAAACGDATAVSDSSVGGLSYATFDGETASFDDRIGTPMVVNFFAEWCVNCVHEMPDFQEVSLEFAGEVDFLGISIDKGPAEALALIDATGVTYDVGWDPGEDLYSHFRGLSMPTTAFVDATGRITRVWSGVLDADALRDKINEEIF